MNSSCQESQYLVKWIPGPHHNIYIHQQFALDELILDQWGSYTDKQKSFMWFTHKQRHG